MNSIIDKRVNSQAAGLISVMPVRTSTTWRLASIETIPSRHIKKRAADATTSGFVVFLPAAGYRNGTTVNNAGTNGNYWSSTANPTNANNAYNVNFNSGNLNPANNNNRNNGNSVRLVRSAESTYHF